MKNNIITLGLLMATVFTSCNNDNIMDEAVAVNGETAVRFDACIDNFSRTVTEGKKTTFVEGDKIGIFEIIRENGDVLSPNLEYSLEEGLWNSEKSISFPIDGSAVNFYAYYPYSKSNSGLDFKFAVSADQSVAENYNKSDLLLAQHTATAGNEESISLVFSHQMAMVEVVINNVNLDGESIASVSLKAKPGVDVSLKDQTVTLDEASELMMINMFKDADNTYRAVIPSQQTVSGKLICITTSSGKQIWYRAETPVSVEAGKINKITIGSINI